MRQAGILAAAALHALDHHVERLAEDHANARRLAEGLAEAKLIRGPAFPVETNILFVDFGVPAPEAVAKLKAQGVLTNSEGPRFVRFVCHLDLSAADVGEAISRASAAFPR